MSLKDDSLKKSFWRSLLYLDPGENLEISQNGVYSAGKV